MLYQKLNNFKVAKLITYHETNVFLNFTICNIKRANNLNLLTRCRYFLNAKPLTSIKKPLKMLEVLLGMI